MELLAIFIAYPRAALIVSGALFVLAWLKRKMLPGVVAGLWASYAYYEYLMHTRVLCTGECNIRIDLLLIYPALLSLTVWAVARSIRSRPR
jgi:hypothetical protein